MGKDIRRKTRGSWWFGWVKYTYYDFLTESEQERIRSTDWEFATVGQAHREAERLAGAYAAVSRPRLTVIEVGVSRAEESK